MFTIVYGVQRSGMTIQYPTTPFSTVRKSSVKCDFSQPRKNTGAHRKCWGPVISTVPPPLKFYSNPWLVTYRGDVPARRRSPITVLTGLDVDQLRWYAQPTTLLLLGQAATILVCIQPSRPSQSLLPSAVLDIVAGFCNIVGRNFVLSTKWKQIEHVQFVSTLHKRLPIPYHLMSYSWNLSAKWLYKFLT